MGILEKLKELEAEYNRTQKNKATEYHLGQLKAKIAKLRTQLLEGSSAGGGGPGSSPQRRGQARTKKLAAAACAEGGGSKSKASLRSPVLLSSPPPLKQPPGHFPPFLFQERAPKMSPALW